MAGKDKKRRGAAIPPPSSAASAKTVGFLVHGWLVFLHPLLLGQLEKLATAAEKEPALTPGPNRKLLGHLRDLMFDNIPQLPDAPAFRHGGALRGGRREWFRAKTGNGRYRLFYRFDSRARIIVYVWVNDDVHPYVDDNARATIEAVEQTIPAIARLGSKPLAPSTTQRPTVPKRRGIRQLRDIVEHQVAKVAEQLPVWAGSQRRLLLGRRREFL